MTSNPHDRAILAFALPALATLAADPLVSLVDTAFVGRLGTEALGALGVNTGVFALAFLVFNFLAYGTTPLVAHALGRARRDEAGRVVGAALALAVGMGVAGLCGLELLAEPIAAAMGTEESLWEPTLAYLRVRALAAPAVLLVTVGNGAFRGYGDTRTPLRLALLLNLTNLLLDPVLIFGLGWGIAGAAWATVAAQWVGALGFVASLVLDPRVALAPPHPRDVRRLLGVGSILSVRTFSLVFTLTVATSLAARMGPVVIAAHQVAWQLWLLFALIIDAFALAGQSLVAAQLGERRPDKARQVADRLLVWGLRAGLALGVLIAIGSPVWPWLFHLEPEVAQELRRVLPLVALLQPLNGLVFVWDGIFIGARAFATLAWQMVLAASLTLVALFAVRGSGGGLLGLWCCLGFLVSLRGLGQASHYWGRRSVLRG